MGAFGTYLLAVAVFIGTVILLASPIPKLEKWMRGKKKSEIKAEIEAWYDKTDAGEILFKGCGFVLYFSLSIFYAFVVEPLAVIVALINKIGYQPLAYAMLVIVALSWQQIARGILSNKKKPTAKAVVTTAGGEQIEGEVVELSEEIQLGHPAWIGFKRIFFSLPTFYLWYLFLVVIGVS